MSETHETVNEMWASFAKAVLPPGVSPVQRQEMRRAFMAGAWGMLQAFQRISEPDVSEEEGVTVMQDFVTELRRFNEDVQRGQA